MSDKSRNIQVLPAGWRAEYAQEDGTSQFVPIFGFELDDKQDITFLTMEIYQGKIVEQDVNAVNLINVHAPDGTTVS